MRQMVSYKRLKTIEIFISRDVVAAIYERRSLILQEGPTIIFEWENFGVLDEWLIMAVMGCGHTRRFDSMLYNR